MPAIDFRAARAQVRLAEVLALIDFTPSTRHGEALRGLCPVHRSRNAASRSFAAHLGKGVWHCFGCGAGGNALDLWAAVTQRALHAAVFDLYARLNRDVPLLASPRRKPTEKSTMPEP
jgi:DNA primase